MNVFNERTTLSRALLMRPTADRKKLLWWREVLVLMDRSLLPEGSVTRSLCPGWEGSAIIFPARLRVLDAYRSWKDGRLHPITFSAERITRCSLLLSLAVAAAYQTVMEEVRMDSMMQVEKCTIIAFGKIGRASCRERV